MLIYGGVNSVYVLKEDRGQTPEYALPCSLVNKEASLGKTMQTDFLSSGKRIRLGIWGLGRGGNFIDSARALGIDVVAGCDYNEHMRRNFAATCPDAFVTDDEDAFLAQDFDAVLVATWFPAHAKDSIKALRAGKHVMCEVTSFMTPAEGVALVEAVESSGKVYNLLENYPFSKENQYARKLWQEGFFGDFIYGEYDYNHDCRTLSYTYIDGVPVNPGWEAHNWRSWLPAHYYCTHSLGPVMRITGLRPVSVVAHPVGVAVPGRFPRGGYNEGTLTPSLFRMSNGGVMRNLMGEGTGDTHARRLWGTRASYDFTHDPEIRVGCSGHGRILHVKPEWPEFGDLAEKAGHGGGDFWELFYFAREILTGEPGPWTLYDACDVTIAGIMANRSSRAGGTPMEVPDFRDPAVRERYRDDDEIPEHMDPKRIFPDGHDTRITKDFATVMSNFSGFWEDKGLILVRNARDGMRLYPDLATDTDRFAVQSDVRRLLRELPAFADNCRAAKRILEAYPDCPAAAAIRSSLEIADAAWVLDTDNALEELRAWLLQA